MLLARIGIQKSIKEVKGLPLQYNFFKIHKETVGLQLKMCINLAMQYLMLHTYKLLCI
jgi:hypothetical protein